MIRFLSGVFLILVPLLTRAAEEAAEIPPPADVSLWPMIIVALVFFGMIGGFLAFIWFKERERKELEKGSS